MSQHLLFDLSVSFSIITGTAAGILSIQTWEILRRSPFGRAVAVLSVVMAIFILYHVLLFLYPMASPVAAVVKSALFTGVGIFIVVMIWSQNRMRTRTRADGSSQ